MHSPDRVLLRKSTDGSFIEAGVLLERIKGKTWRLRLPDGSEVEHELQSSIEVPVVRGSMNYRIRTDQALVESQLRDSPQVVFRQLLAEAPKGAKASDLKNALHGIDRSLVDKGWTRAKKELDAADDVRRSDAKVPTYSLILPEAASADISRPPPDARPSVDAAGVHDGASTIERDLVDLADGDTEASRPPAGPNVEDQVPSDEPNAPSQAPASTLPMDPLVQFLYTQGLVEQHEDLSSLARRPLFLSQTLARFKTSELSHLLETVEPRHRLLLAAVLGTGRGELLREEAGRVPRDMYEAALKAGAGEVNRAESASDRQLALLKALLERATASHAIAPTRIVALANTFADVERKKRAQRDQTFTRKQTSDLSLEARDGLDKALEALAGHASFVASTQGGAGLSSLARAARQAEFARTGGRSLLVSRLYRHSPGVATDPMWWEHATFDQLGGRARASGRGVAGREDRRPSGAATRRQGCARGHDSGSDRAGDLRLITPGSLGER